MTKFKLRPRSRLEFERFIERSIKEEKSDAVRTILDSQFAQARAFLRNDSMLGTLARLVEACDDIECGRAAQIYAKADVEPGRRGAGPWRINSMTVETYIRARQAIDGASGSEWTGPVAVTIRRTEGLSSYVKARADKAVAPQRSRIGSRERRLMEIVDQLPVEDRNEMRFALEDGKRAVREVQLLKSAIKDLRPGLSLNELLGSQLGATSPTDSTGISTKETRTLKQLLHRLTSDAYLRPFGLMTDGKRVKMAVPPATRLIEKAELEILLRLAGMPDSGEY